MVDKKLSEVRTDNAAVAPTGLEPIETVQSAISAAFVFAELANSPLNDQVGTAYTLIITDQSKTVTMNNGAANILTIPLNASVAFHIGAKLLIRQIGAGGTTVVGDGGVTVVLDANASLVMDGAQQQILLHKTAINTWHAAPVATGSGGGAASVEFHGAFIEELSTVGRNASQYTVTFDNVVYDTDDFADLGSDNDRLTIPAGVTKVKLNAVLNKTGGTSGATNYLRIEHYDSGDTLLQQFSGTADLSPLTIVTSTPVLAVAVGDYFIAKMSHNDAAWDQLNASLSMEYKDGTLTESAGAAGGPQGCELVVTTPITGRSTGATPITWETEVYDDNGFFSGGDPTKLTIPTGVTRVNVSAYFTATSFTDATELGLFITLYDSGDSFIQNISVERLNAGSTTPGINAAAFGITVSPTDYILIRHLAGDASWDISGARCSIQDVTP